MPCRRTLSVSALLFLALPVAAGESAPYKLADGPLTVQTADDLTIRDKQRDKELHVRVYYPDGDGPFPVIVFSHGFGAGKDAFAPIGRHWASHGYVSIHPQHADAIDRNKADKGGLPGDGVGRETLRERLRQAGGVKGIGGSPDQIADRVRDVSALIDALDRIEEKVPALKGKLDREKIGVAGHSYGACVSMLIGGATIDVGGKPRTFADARVKCVLPISAAGTGEYGLTKDSWKGCKRPALYITGTKDIRPGHEFAWRKEPFDLSPDGDKFLLVVEGATHFHFGGGPPGLGRLGGSSTVAVATDFVKTSSTAFFDAYLKGDEKGRAFLADGLAKFVADRATLASK